MICGADGWADMVEYARVKEEWLRTFLELPNGIPCDDTYRRVFSAIDPQELLACFLSWVRSVVGAMGGKLVAIDGKTARRIAALHRLAASRNPRALQPRPSAAPKPPSARPQPPAIT